LGKTVSSGKSIASTSDYKPGEFLINYNQTNNEDGIINDQSGTSNRIFGGFFQGTLEDFKIRLNGREGMRTDNRLTRKDLGLENIVEISEEENSVLPYNTASTTGNETTMNIVFMTQEDYTKYNTWIASQTDNGQPMVPVGTTNDQPVQGTTSNDPNYFQNGTLDYMMPQEPRKELQNTEK